VRRSSPFPAWAKTPATRLSFWQRTKWLADRPDTGIAPVENQGVRQTAPASRLFLELGPAPGTVAEAEVMNGFAAGRATRYHLIGAKRTKHESGTLLPNLRGKAFPVFRAGLFLTNLHFAGIFCHNRLPRCLVDLSA